MFIKKSNGKLEKVSFLKLTNRIEKQNQLGQLNLDLSEVIQSVYSSLFSGITTDEVESIIIQTLAVKNFIDPKYDQLAARIAISNIHKRLPSTKFSLCFKKNFDLGLLDRKYLRFVRKYSNDLDKAFSLERDFLINTSFAVATFQKSYFLKHPEKPDMILESPAFVYMRVALNMGIHEGIETVLQIYNSISMGKYIHGSPTLFNSATKNPGLASCFLLTVGDSIDSIYETLKTVALISASGGGVGIDFSHVRGQGALIKSTNTPSIGIIPFIKIYDASTVVSQAGKRNGSFAVYLRPTHPEFPAFLELKANVGGETEGRARNLFYGLWISDTFMKYVKNSNLEEFSEWYFFDPSVVPSLYNTYGEEHFKNYQDAVQKKLYSGSMNIQQLWMKILNMQLETGTPYMTFACTANQRNNLKHWGEIKSSNLCCSGDTLLLTSDGYFPMQELENESDINVWNGKEWAPVTVRKTNENAPMIKIYFSSGLMLQCTPYHKFFIQNRATNQIDIIEAKDLKRGMVLKKFDIPSGTFVEQGEPLFDIKQKNPPLHGSRKQIEDWLLHHFKNVKEKSHIENLGAYLLSQQLVGAKDIEMIVYRMDMEPTYGPTYCAREEKESAIIVNGILTHNCSEIMLPSLPNADVAVCNLASINLTRHFDQEKKKMDFLELQKTTQQVVRNLNLAIDTMCYPHKEAEKTNKLHRPIAIGIQGLADVFFLHGYAFDSDEARDISRHISECIYYASYMESNILAEEYPEKIPASYAGSELSKGRFQFDFYPEDQKKEIYSKLKCDWNSLREKVKLHGVLNMTTTTIMPTATTSSVLGNFECIEAPISNIFNRSTNGGNFITVNKYLVEKLQSLELWTENMREQIQESNGSIQNIKGIPVHVKEMFKTAFEIDQLALVKLAIERQPFIDHSQSLNLFHSGNKAKQNMTNALMYGHANGLKTGVYYTRSKAAVLQKYEPMTCSIDNRNCEACSS